MLKINSYKFAGSKRYTHTFAIPLILPIDAVSVQVYYILTNIGPC